MENLQNMSKYQKQETLYDWIKQLDNSSLDDILIEYLGYEYGEEENQDDYDDEY